MYRYIYIYIDVYADTGVDSDRDIDVVIDLVMLHRPSHVRTVTFGPLPSPAIKPSQQPVGARLDRRSRDLVDRALCFPEEPLHDARLVELAQTLQPRHLVPDIVLHEADRAFLSGPVLGEAVLLRSRER